MYGRIIKLMVIKWVSIYTIRALARRMLKEK